eukprot:TRINITY_DN27227_c0_g1_i8.p1 TRINITY_DN27227_c0_g1~~TRINITY_DN27227_c0_g1_i8.p1  ORF type:complete len:357 (+),score=31.89 TRINITY_DN27227_c0_g1_i8:53-1072(+)
MAPPALKQLCRSSLRLTQHAVRGCAGGAFEFPDVGSVTVKIPMYCGPGAKDHYVGEANADFTKRATDYWKFLTSGTVMDMLLLYWHSREDRSVEMYDARALEAAEGLSKRDFFHKHGFVLLDHQTAMNAQDWRDSEYIPLKSHDSGKGSARPAFTQGATPVREKYNKEIPELLKDLLPSATEFKAPVRGIRRGPGGAYEKMYASVVHTDVPVDYETFRHTNRWLGCSEHIQHFEETNAASFYVINLWRPILPMTGPVKSTPLAMLHPRTLHYDDFVRVDLLGGQFPDGQSYLHVRYRPEHRWFYYPDMTTNEVLVWKQAHFVKGENMSRAATPHSLKRS